MESQLTSTLDEKKFLEIEKLNQMNEKQLEHEEFNKTLAELDNENHE